MKTGRKKLLSELLFGGDMPTSPKLGIKDEKETKLGEITVREIKFNSVWYPTFRTNPSGEVYESKHVDYIPGLILLPKKENGKGMVALHQHGTEFDLGKSEVAGLRIGKHGEGYNYGYELAKRGYTVLCFDFKPFEDRQIGHENNKGYWGERFDKQELNLDGMEPMGRHVLDTIRAVDVLESKGINDIGIIGHSLGGMVVHYAMALDERIKAGAANCSIATLQSVRDINRVHSWSWSIKGFKQRFGEIHKLYELIKAPTHISAGTDDPAFPIAGVRQFVEWARNSGGDITFYKFPGKHSFPTLAREQAYHFLEERL